MSKFWIVVIILAFLLGAVPNAVIMSRAAYRKITAKKTAATA